MRFYTTKAEVLEIVSSTRPDCLSEVFENITDVEQEDGTTEWIMITTECRVCTYHSISIVPVEIDEDAIDNLECPNCGAMAQEEYD